VIGACNGDCRPSLCVACDRRRIVRPYPFLTTGLLVTGTPRVASPRLQAVFSSTGRGALNLDVPPTFALHPARLDGARRLMLA